jgi:hypothetical protein
MRELQLVEQEHHGPEPAGAVVGAPELRTVVMGLIKKAASILTLGGVSSHSGRDSQARARAERTEVETKVAEEQAAAIARGLDEDEAHRQADMEEIAEKEAEALPWDRPAGS